MVPAVGMPVDQALDVEPQQRLAHRCSGQAQAGGQAFLTQPHAEPQLAEQQPALQVGIGLFRP